MKLKYWIPVLGLFILTTEEYLKIKQNPKKYAKMIVWQEYQSMCVAILAIFLCMMYLYYKK